MALGVNKDKPMELQRPVGFVDCRLILHVSTPHYVATNQDAPTIDLVNSASVQIRRTPTDIPQHPVQTRPQLFKAAFGSRILTFASAVSLRSAHHSYRCHTTHANRLIAMASCQDHHMNTIEATIKRHFLDLAKMLEKGHPLPIQTNNDTIIQCPMPSGRDLQSARSIIEGYIASFPQRMASTGYGEWKIARIMSVDKKDFRILVYRCDAFDSDEKAKDYAMSAENSLQHLQYTDDEL